MPSTGLVLGAGGSVGMAWHAGVVAALDEAAGFDARRADVIVGTSAGSAIAASLRAGLAPRDHHARATDAPLTEAGAGLLTGLPEQVDLPLYPLRSQGLPLPASPRLVLPAFLRRRGPRPGLALSGLLPRGGVDTGFIADSVDALYDTRWPDRPTWICAVDLSRGERVVFGRDDRGVDSIGVAVAASSAIPGFFRPVVTRGGEYVDGGMFSATNADLVADLGLDLVVVSSPMSVSRGALGSVAAAWRAIHGLRLRQELEAVRAGGAVAVVVQPTADDLPVLGTHPLDRSRRGEIAEQARESTRRRLERLDTRARALLLTPERVEPT